MNKKAVAGIAGGVVLGILAILSVTAQSSDTINQEFDSNQKVSESFLPPPPEPLEPVEIKQPIEPIKEQPTEPIEVDVTPSISKPKCDPSYPDVCISPRPPKLNCKDIPFTDFRVLSPDHHRFDDNNNGIGCESQQDTSQIPDLKSCTGNAKCFSGLVTRVTDGDTINVDGIPIRFALSSAPELDEFEGEEARELIANICPVGSNALVDEDDGQTQGSYDRIIAVVYCNNKNLNSELMDSGIGYLSLEFCSDSEFASSSWVQKYGCQFINGSKTSSGPKTVKGNCDSSYPDFCIPSSPPDLDCKDIPQKRFTVLPPDPHRFDGDKDGIGCEN